LNSAFLTPLTKALHSEWLKLVSGAMRYSTLSVFASAGIELAGLDARPGSGTKMAPHQVDRGPVPVRIGHLQIGRTAPPRTMTISTTTMQIEIMYLARGCQDTR
jgi:hypothetical protein